MNQHLMTFKRYLIFLTGLLTCAFGVALVTKANLGTSPISSVPYVLSLKYMPTLGQFTLYMSLILFVGQLLLLRKSFPLHQLLQIPMSILFSLFIDFSMLLLTRFNPQWLPVKGISLIIGCIILGIGVYLEFLGDVVMLPGEAFVHAVSKVFKTEMGSTKMGFDTTLTLFALIISFVLFSEIRGVGMGTIIAAFLVGTVAKQLKKRLPHVEQLLLGQSSSANIEDYID